jgi:hypothetical protein
MDRSRVEKNSDKFLVAKKFIQVFLLLLLCCALRVKQEIVDERVNDFITCGYGNRLNDLLIFELVL